MGRSSSSDSSAKRAALSDEGDAPTPPSGSRLGRPSRDAASAALICVLGLRGVPGVMGGVESHCEHIYRRLSQITGHRYMILARAGYVSKPQTLGSRLDVIPIWSVRNKYFEALPNALAALFYARFVLRAKLVHIHAIGPGLVTPLAKLLGMKVIFTHHGQDYRRAKWNWLAKSILRVGESASLRFADRTIVVSRSLAEAIQRKHPRRARRIWHIPNGATAFDEDEDGRPSDLAATLARFGLEPRGYVLAVGRLVPEKGFHDLIYGFREAETGLKLVIAGGADHDDRYSRNLLAQASDDVIFAGPLAREQLRALYANASLFVLPSSHEGMPIAALEAIGANAPVLLSDIAANRDLDLPERHYFPAGDAKALAQRLKGSHDELRVEPAFVLTKFSWDDIALATSKVYAEVLFGN